MEIETDDVIRRLYELNYVDPNEKILLQATEVIKHCAAKHHPLKCDQNDT